MKPEKWVLRWFSGDEPKEYFAAERTVEGCLCPFATKQKDAERFGSAASARAACPSYQYLGADGPDDTSGWKPVRLVSKK